MLEGYEPEWLPVLMRLINDVLTKQLTTNGVILQKTKKSKTLCEMEFLFPIKNLSPHKLENTCRRFDPISKNMTLNFNSVSGMLKGFIDLTFEFNGKFYVLDWKSNYLADDESFYTEDALIKAMQDHRYDLQYQIYSLALHKYLLQRLPNYSYEQHFGGAIYLFLRGINKNNNNGIFFSKTSLEFLNELDETVNGTKHD